MWNEATWVNGKKKLKGRWYYSWGPNKFWISLDSKDPITGEFRRFDVYGDSPEWGKWKLVRENTTKTTTKKELGEK